MPEDSDYNDLIRKSREGVSPDIKLALLRSEMLRHIEIARALARLLGTADLNDLNPEEFRDSVNKLIKVTDDLKEVLDAFTGF